MRSSVFVVGLVSFGLAACTKDVPPEAPYLAAAEARTKAICECRASDGVDCLNQMEERFPLVPPHGESVESYESRLDEAETAKLTELRKRASGCATMIREVHRLSAH